MQVCLPDAVVLQIPGRRAHTRGARVPAAQPDPHAVGPATRRTCRQILLSGLQTDLKGAVCMKIRRNSSAHLIEVMISVRSVGT